MDIAMSDSQVFRAVPLLLELGKVEAAERMLIERQQEVTDAGYPLALNLIDHLEKHDAIMGTIICYRALLMDLLNRGYSKGYCLLIL